MKIGELLTDESKWCKGPFAQDADGNPKMPHEEGVCKWCLIGAAWFCYKGSNWNEFHAKLTDVVRNLTPFRMIVDFNEDPNTTFADVRKVLQAAGEMP